MSEYAPSGTRASRGQAKKDEITANDLPVALRSNFRGRMIPYLRDYTGTLGPWEHPTDDDIYYYFGLSYLDLNSQLKDDLFVVISKLVRFLFHDSSILISVVQVDDRISEWRNHFASTAMLTLEKLFDQYEIYTPDERSIYATWMLGENYKTCPFYYKEYEDGKPPVVRIAYFPSES